MYEFSSLRQNNLKLQKILINNLNFKTQEKQHSQPFPINSFMSVLNHWF